MDKKIFEQLAAPFPVKDIEWRIAQSGFKQNDEPWAKCLAYVNARAIMDRLDAIVGHENWSHEFTPFSIGEHHGAKCRLSITDRMEARPIVHEDVCDASDIEPLKGAVSGALKRAAVHFGIGRYLYDLDEGWAIFSDQGRFNAKIKDKSGKEAWAKWDPPELPDWALPAKTEQKASNSPVAPAQAESPAPVTPTAKKPTKAKLAPEATAPVASVEPPAPTVAPPKVPDVGKTPGDPNNIPLKDVVKNAICMAFRQLKVEVTSLEHLLGATQDTWTEGHKKIALEIHTKLVTKKVPLAQVADEYGCTYNADTGIITPG